MVFIPYILYHFTLYQVGYGIDVCIGALKLDRCVRFSVYIYILCWEMHCAGMYSYIHPFSSLLGPPVESQEPRGLWSLLEHWPDEKVALLPWDIDVQRHKVREDLSLLL